MVKMPRKVEVRRTTRPMRFEKIRFRIIRIIITAMVIM